MDENEKPKSNSGTGLIIMTILSLPVWVLDFVFAVRFARMDFQIPPNYTEFVSAEYFRVTSWVSVIVSVFTPIFLFLSWRFWNRGKRELKILFLILQFLLLGIANISLLAFFMGLTFEGFLDGIGY